jgi:polyhydroxybutyrate depolymerase
MIGPSAVARKGRQSMILPGVPRAALALALALAAAPEAMACGRDSDCALGDRSYRIVLPERRGQAGPPGAILFVHGYRGTAEGVMRNAALTGLADELGVAFVAVQAAGPEWNLPGVPSVDARAGVDELAYFDALAADLTARFGIDRARVLVAGFSSGAMMVWHLACQRGGAYAGYAPMSGTFWAPVPEACPGGPVNLIHYHGAQDPVVPLAGRQIKDGRQGDVREALATMARSGAYRPAEAVQEEGLDCRKREDGAGHRLELCLFQGQHELRVRHIARAWEIFSRSRRVDS